MMAAIKSITSSVAWAGFAFLSVSASAAGRDTTLRAMPMHGVSFDIGSKHAVSYFLVKDGNCDLTVWLVDRAREEEVASDTPTRMVIEVAPGKSTQVGSEEGRVAEFACSANAGSMSIRTLTETAYSKPRP